MDKLRIDNQRYLSWLTQEPKSIPALENKIKALESQIASAIRNDDSTSSSTLPKSEVQKLPYEFTSPFLKGESFVDPKTKATIGVSDIHSDYTATGILYLPGSKSVELDRVKPGVTWEFEKDGAKYKMTLDGVNWISNSLKASVVELGEIKEPNKQIQVTPKSGAPD